MKSITNPLFLLALALALSVPLAPHSVRAETVRQPVWAGRFYEADPSELRQDIDQLTRKAQKTHIQIPKNKRLRAIIMPHAGYIYSGWTAAHAARVLPADQFSKVILLEPRSSYRAQKRGHLRRYCVCDSPGENHPSQRRHKIASAAGSVSTIAGIP